MEGPFVVIPEKIAFVAASAKKRFHQAQEGLIESPGFVTGAIGMGPALLGETIRAQLVNPASDPYGNLNRAGTNEPIPAPILSPDTTNPILYEFLQSTGDAMWGYNISYFVYSGITYAEFFLGRRMSEKLKVGVSLGFSTAIITAAETGYMWGTVTQDTNDIWGGLIGPGLWFGLNYISRKYIKFEDKRPK